MKENYIKLATDIINQPAHTNEDLKKLSQYRFHLSIEYKETNTRGSAREGSYNSMRSNGEVNLVETGMPVSKAGGIAKANAEEEYGDYRAINAEAQGIKQIMDTIAGFIIAVQVETKSLQETKF